MALAVAILARLSNTDAPPPWPGNTPSCHIWKNRPKHPATIAVLLLVPPPGPYPLDPVVVKTSMM